MPASVYAHVPEHIHDRKVTLDFLWTIILILTLLSAASLLILLLFSQSIDRYFFKTGSSLYLYGLAFIGTQMYIWLNFVRDTLNASGKFLHINIATNVSNIVKAFLLIFISLSGHLTIAQVLIILGIVGPMIVFIYIFMRSRWLFKALSQAKASYQHVKLKFTFTYFISTQLFQLATRADLFMIAYFLTQTEVGYYGLSQRVILAVVTSADSITQVMSPQFAKIKTQVDVKKLLKQSSFYMLIPAGMFLTGSLLPTWIYTLVFGDSYQPSTFITKLLSFAYIPFPFLAALLLFFLYTVKKPHYLLISNALFFTSIAIVHTLLIPHLRLVAPAISYFTAFVLVSFIMILMYRYELKKLPTS